MSNFDRAQIVMSICRTADYVRCSMWLVVEAQGSWTGVGSEGSPLILIPQKSCC